MSEDDDYGIEEDWDKWLLDQYEIDDDFHNVAGEIGEEGEYQCRQCLTFFSDKSEFVEHIRFHVANYVLDFIGKHQPVTAKTIHTKFKNFDLSQLLDNGKAHFSFEEGGWALADYDFEKFKNKEQIKFDSLSNTPCIDCIYEEDCSTDNENKKANPLHCELISEWVTRNPNNQEQIKKVKDGPLENIKCAFLFCKRSETFDFVGILEKNKNRAAPNKFIIVDEAFNRVPIRLDYYDERKFKPGDKVEIIGAKLTGTTHDLCLQANFGRKIQKI